MRVSALLAGIQRGGTGASAGSRARARARWWGSGAAAAAPISREQRRRAPCRCCGGDDNADSSGGDARGSSSWMKKNMYSARASVVPAVAGAAAAASALPRSNSPFLSAAGLIEEKYRKVAHRRHQRLINCQAHAPPGGCLLRALLLCYLLRHHRQWQPTPPLPSAAPPCSPSAFSRKKPS